MVWLVTPRWEAKSHSLDFLRRCLFAGDSNPNALSFAELSSPPSGTMAVSITSTCTSSGTGALSAGSAISWSSIWGTWSGVNCPPNPATAGVQIIPEVSCSSVSSPTESASTGIPPYHLRLLRAMGETTVTLSPSTSLHMVGVCGLESVPSKVLGGGACGIAPPPVPCSNHVLTLGLSCPTGKVGFCLSSASCTACSTTSPTRPCTKRSTFAFSRASSHSCWYFWSTFWKGFGGGMYRRFVCRMFGQPL